MLPCSSLRLVFVVVAPWLVSVISAHAAPSASPAPSLAERFERPAQADGVYAYWHWMGRHITREGITKDLEEMAAAGFAGVELFQLADVTTGGPALIANNPGNSLRLLSPEWWALVGHTVGECDRLGLRFWLHNTAGWSAGGGPWVTEELARKRLVFTETRVAAGVAPTGPLRRPEPLKGTVSLSDVAVLAAPASGPIPFASIAVLTDKLSADDKLAWTAPADRGEWIVYRFAEIVDGTKNGPTDPEASGFMFDNLRAEATRLHLRHMLDPLMKVAGRHAGRALGGLAIDSLDVHAPLWTTGLPEKVRERFGHDLVPWLVTYAKRDIAEADLAERFKQQMSLLRQELMRDNLYRVFHDEMRARKLTLVASAHVTPDPKTMLQYVDRPQIEFWIGSRSIIKSDTPGAARAFGLHTITAEAFTAFPEDAMWSESPARLKPFADMAMGSGVTRMMLHSVPHQSFLDARFRPGMTMGWWGTKFGWQQTWWKPGKAFFDYLTRSSVLLEHGEVPTRLLVIGWRPEQSYGPQHAVDYASAETLSRAKVVNGQVVLPSGRRYALVGLSAQPAMSLALARTVKRLVSEGAVIMGTRPERSTELADREAADAEVARIGREVWGEQPIPENALRAYGKGRVMGHRSLNAALVSLGAVEDLVMEPGSAFARVRFARRSGPEADLYFLAHNNAAEPAVEFTGVFGTTAGRPELWDPLRGTRRALPEFSPDAKAGVTRVPLRLEPGESVFVVFPRQATVPAALGRNFVAPSPLREVAGPWRVSFAGARADGSAASATLEKLSDWSTATDPDIKYFSGTATYTTEFALSASEASAPLSLDLGRVEVIARVKLNGRDLGVVWAAPWRIALAGARAGRNTLEIEVTNLWANRLIGDEQLPADIEWGKPQRGLQRKDPIGAAIAAWPDWFVKNQPRTSQRRTLTSWRHFEKDSPLAPSGLLGPVSILTAP